MRVQKIIANNGICSRRKAEKLIQEGKVKVNGKVVKIGAVAELTDKISVEGKVLNKVENKYLLLHKPKNYVTSLKDDYEQTIRELIPERLSPCGRLDKDAEGLLLLTNNGDLANKIMHPSYEIEKVYVAVTDKPIKKEILSFINRYGVNIKEGYVETKIKKKATKVYEIRIHVGYHKVVKKIFDKFNVRVKNLKRTQLGPLRLGKLKKKEWKYLSKEDAKSLEKYVSKLKRKPKNRREHYKKSLDFKYAFKDLMKAGDKNFKKAYVKPKEKRLLKKKVRLFDERVKKRNRAKLDQEKKRNSPKKQNSKKKTSISGAKTFEDWRKDK